MNKLTDLINKNNTYSYKYICEYVGENRTSGEARQNQFIRWNKYVLIEQVGRKYKITRERTLDEKDDYKLKGTYLELLETLMYSYLSKLPENTLTITIPKLMEKMYLVNNNYSYGKYNKFELNELIKNEVITPIDDKIPMAQEIDNFFIHTETNYRHKIKTMLKDMQEKALISQPHEWLCLGYKVNKYTNIRRATKDEYEDFLKIQSDILKDKYMFIDKRGEFRPKTKKELTRNERFGFYQTLMSRTKIEFNCSFYSYEYELIINRIGIEEHLIRNIKTLQSAINKKVITQLIAKDNCLSLVNWFIDKDTELNLKQILIDNRKNEIDKNIDNSIVFEDK